MVGTAWPRAWLIVQEADPRRRQWWADTLAPERIVVLETSIDLCWQRIGEDSQRMEVEALQRSIAQKWWRKYQRRDGDEVIVLRETGKSQV